MRYQHPAKELFITNRKNFTAQMMPNSVAIFHSAEVYPMNADLFHPFEQDSDFYYLTGVDQEESILLLAPNHPDPKHREVLFIRASDPTTVIWEGAKLSVNQSSDISGITTIYNLDKYDFVLNELIINADNIYFNFNEYPKVLSDVPTRNARKAEEVRKKYPAHQYKRSAPILNRLRMIKSEEELKQISTACDITHKSFVNLMEKLKPGMNEYQAQAEIEYMFNYHGANGAAYETIVAGGANACVLHYITNDQELKDGDLLLLDMGANYGNYAADMSRTIPVNGKFTERQKECYNAVLAVFKRAKELLVPGNTMDEVNKQVKIWMQDACIELGLFTKEDLSNQKQDYELVSKYYMHGVSHHMGLDVHDVFDKYAKFEAGMVFTCEPGIYINEESIGIRIENDILVTCDGPVDLMANIPIEVEEIEAIMQKGKA